MVGFVAVHLGAGTYARSFFSKYEKLGKDACNAAVKCLAAGGDAVEAVTKAVCILEDSPLTNAGRGSNLNMRGRVECDASVMAFLKSQADGEAENRQGEVLFGSVGAIPRVKNPVEVASRLLREQVNGGDLTCGRIPPSFLVGEGATCWADERGISVLNHDPEVQSSESGSIVDPSNCVAAKEASVLITKGAVRQFRENMKKLLTAEKRKLSVLSSNTDELENPAKRKRKSRISSVNLTGNEIQIDWSSHPASVSDTVGAICVDSDGNIASAASSGGIMLKQPGRVGPAACYGAGVWVDSECRRCRTACCASGSGEYLMRTSVSERVCEIMKTAFGSCDATAEESGLDFDFASDLGRKIDECYRGSPALRNVPNREKLLGILGVNILADQNRLALTSFHSTKHFCVAYCALNDDQSSPVSYVSALPPEKEEGSCYVVNCTVVDLERKK